MPEVLFNQALHFDGKKWMFVKTPNPAGHSMGDVNALDSVRCTAPNDCWAAGTGGDISRCAPQAAQRDAALERQEMVHGDGAQPGRQRQVLHSTSINTLACTAPTNCWAVGIAAKFASKGFEHNEALHWTGKKWALVKTPNPGGKVNELFGVTCVAAQELLGGRRRR